MAELRDLLAKYIDDEEKLSSVVEELNQDFGKSYIPKGRFNEVNEELKIVKGQLEENKQAMTSLSEKASSLEEYEKKLADLTQLNSDIEAKSQEQIASITKKTQLKELLLLNNAHKDALDLLVEKYSSTIEIEDGKIKQADKLLETIKTEKSGLFVETKVDSFDKGGNKDKPKEDEDKKRLERLFGIN